jgi:uncharacterized membrane protein
MIEVPIQAKVECTDGPCGQCVAVIVNSQSRLVIFFVVADHGLTNRAPRLVPVAQVAAADIRTLHLNCPKEALNTMTPFMESTYQVATTPDSHGQTNWGYMEMMSNSSTPDKTYYKPTGTTNVSSAEVVFRKDVEVKATDGGVGKLGYLIADPESGMITSLSLQEGRLWGKQQTILPITAVESVDAKTVYLKLDKATVQSLPSTPVPRGAYSKSMRIDLLGFIYDKPGEAAEMKESAIIQHNQKTLKLVEAASVVKDAEGNLKFDDTADWSARKGRWTGGIAGAAAGLVLGPVGVVGGAIVGALAGNFLTPKLDRGLSNRFLTSFAEQIKPNGSGLLLIIEHEWKDKTVKALNRGMNAVVALDITEAMLKDVLGEEAEPAPEAAAELAAAEPVVEVIPPADVTPTAEAPEAPDASGAGI